ncbi:MAG: TlpA disulfide reductase family protein [Bacteroidota bacterium]|nr:TlpA disulfide reductase family protein [Bacteroidota bacterium]
MTLKHLLAYSVIAFASFSLFAQNQYVIKGSLEGIESDGGSVILSVLKESGVDTLQIVPIDEGRFVIKGEVTHPEVAYLGIAGYSDSNVFMLEPGQSYSMALRKGERTLIESSSPLQEEMNRYVQEIERRNQAIDVAKRAVEQAREEQKYRTAATRQVELEKMAVDGQCFVDSVITVNRDNVLGAYLLGINLDRESSLQQLETAYQRLSEKGRGTEAGKRIKGLIDAQKNVLLYETAPDFELPDLDGRLHRLMDIDAKIIVLDFWASWCGPCRKENPNMRNLYHDFKAQGLEIVSISLDEDKESWRKAVAADKMNWLQLIAEENWQSEVAKNYNVSGIPTIIVLNGNKQIIAKNIRHKELREFVEKNL